MKMVDILVLNFNKPFELRLCLESIKKFALFDHRTIVFNNGGDDLDQVFALYKENLIDKLIFNKKNEGEGNGCIELYNNCNSEYSLFIENDCELAGPITEVDIDNFIQFLNIPDNKCIDMTGGICGQNIYSGRVFFMNTNFYKNIKKCDKNGVYGGPGPNFHVPPLEHFIQKYFKDNNFNVGCINAYKDNGYLAVRQNPDGSLWNHEPDTKKCWLIKGPVKEKFSYPKFNDAEWDFVILNQKWEGEIPDNEKKESFIVSHWHK